MANTTKHVKSYSMSAARTVADVVKHFIGSRAPAAPSEGTGVAIRRPAYRQQAEWLLMSNVLTRIGQTLIHDVTRQEIAELLDDIARRGAPITANRVYYLLRQCFRFAVTWDLIPRSPIEGMPMPGGRESPRTRALTDAEIAVFWSRVGSADMATSTKLGLML